MNILIVVDMQKDFVDGALGTPEAVAIVPAVAGKIRQYRAAGDVIIATRDTHGENYLETQEGRTLPVVHCVRGTPGWQLDAAVEEALGPDTIYIDKPTFGSLSLITQVGEYAALVGEENVNVEIVGLCTDICVVSNALLLKAAWPEMPIRLDAACCAGVTPQKHAAALETMASCQIRIS
ncbi:MAG: cysteine hydrolase [Oscillospiraceae bacterium]|nr:cysteine hydrolase [Oscillospiraceae bacterium]